MKTFVIRHCRAAATSFVLAAAALAAVAGCVTRPATGSATVAVTRVVPSETEIPGRRLPFDPIFLRSQFDVIRSTPVLTPVVLSNDLGAVLDAAYGWHMACPDAAADRAVACLRTWTDLSIWRNTDLIGIEVSVDRAVPGAEALSRKLAFDIARSYRANAIALREAEAKAAAAQLQSEIDFLRKRLAESKRRDQRRAWESRRAQLEERLEWPGTLVPYVDVRIVDDPERPATQSPSEKKSHAESAETAEKKTHAESAESAEPAARAVPAAAQETFKIPFSYKWDSPQSSEAMTNALSGVFRALAGLPDGLRGFSVTTGNGTKADCSVTFDRGRIDYDTAARALQEALGSVPLPEGARLAIVLSEPRANPVAAAPARAEDGPGRLSDSWLAEPADPESYEAVPPPEGLVPNWLYGVGVDHRKCFEIHCSSPDHKFFSTLGSRASIHSSFKLEWLDADTLLYTSGDIGTWAVVPTPDGHWTIRMATVRRDAAGAVQSFELGDYLYPTNPFSPKMPAPPRAPDPHDVVTRELPALLRQAAAARAADPATNALPAGLPGLYHSRGRPYSSGLVEIDESGRMSAEDRDAKWHPVPATQRKLSPVGTIRPAPEAGPGLLAFTSDETGPDGKRGVGILAFDADRLAIHWLAYDKEHARPWTVEFAETGLFYDPREDLIRLDTDLATLWCDTIYRTEPSDGGVTEIVYSLWDHVGNLSPQQRRDLDEILARKIHSLSSCRAMMHRDYDLGAPLCNPYDGKPDPILDVSPDLRPAITKLSPEKTHAESAETAEPEPRAESAESAELLSEQVGVGSRPDEGEDKHVVANEVDE